VAVAVAWLCGEFDIALQLHVFPVDGKDGLALPFVDGS